MKKLSKLHLRTEQYLTDSEMKLISGGTTSEIYGYCREEAIYQTQCNVKTPCTVREPENGPYYELKYGACHFGYIKSSDLSESCHCKYW